MHRRVGETDQSSFQSYRSVVLIEEIDHVLEACGRGEVSVTVHDTCIHSIPFSLVLVAVSSQLSSAIVTVSCMFW